MELFLASISDSLSIFVPVLVVTAAFCALAWEMSRRRDTATVLGPTLRFPGDSLRPGLSDINEKLVMRLLATVVIALMTGMAAQAQGGPGGLLLAQGVMLTGCAVVLALALWTWETVKVWRASNQGLENERRVGSELNLLMLDGCRVFHDLKQGDTGNVDHIIVSTHAVFMVETKTIKPRWRDRNSADRKVVFTGDQLKFPGYATTQPLRQTLERAQWLAHFLTRMTGGLTIPVYPILTLPGWDVEQRGSGDVQVMNSDSIGFAVVDKAALPMYAAHRQSIVNLLDVHCRHTGT
jgi:hypothetical protein